MSVLYHLSLQCTHRTQTAFEQDRIDHLEGPRSDCIIVQGAYIDQHRNLNNTIIYRIYSIIQELFKHESAEGQSALQNESNFEHDQTLLSAGVQSLRLLPCPRVDVAADAFASAGAERLACGRARHRPPWMPLSCHRHLPRRVLSSILDVEMAEPQDGVGEELFGKRIAAAWCHPVRQLTHPDAKRPLTVLWPSAVCACHSPA